MFRKTITLGLDYKEFTGGTEEINRKMRLLESEFNLAAEQAKEFGDESDQLRLKQEKLQQKIILQTKAVEEAAKAYDKAVVANKDNAKAVDYLDKKLLDARIALQRSKNELNELNAETEKASETNRSFGDAIRDVASALGIDASPALESFASQFDKINENIGESILVVGAIASAFAGLTVAAAGTAEELLGLSSQTGISTDRLQKLNYAAGQVDVSVDTMQDSMTQMIGTMDEARKGSEDAAEAYRKLHVRIQDGTGKLRDSEEVFYEVIDALGRVRNETERDALAMDIFGESAKKLNPLIEAGSQKLRALGLEAEDMGMIMSGKSLEDLAAFKDSMDKFDASVEAAKMQLGMALLPILSKFMDLVSNIPAPVLEVVAVVAAVVAILMTLAKAVKELSALNTVFAATNAAVGASATMSASSLGVMLVVILAIVAAIMILKGLHDTGWLDGITNDVSGVAQSVNNSASTINNSARTTAAQHHASGTRNFTGGRTWVGEAGPEIVDLPAGSRIYSNSESRRMSGGDNYYFNMQTSSIREFNNLVNVAQNRRRIERMK